MDAGLQVAIARQVPLLVAAMLAGLLIVVYVLGCVTGWLGRRVRDKVVLEAVIEARSEQAAATKLATLRAENRRLADALAERDEELGRHRRARMAAENIVGRG